MIDFTRRKAAMAAASATLLAIAGAARAFPTRRLSVVVPFPAGGPADVAARVLQPALQKGLGETVIIENLGGAGGSIGVAKVLSAPADGHTILLTTMAEPILPPLAMASVRYKPEDLRLVAPLSHSNIVLVVRPGLGAGTLNEFLALARNAAKPVSYATPGNGTLYHVMGEHFRSLTATRMLHVPYRGLAPAVNELLAGQVDAAFLPLAGSTRKMVEAGKLLVLGIASGSETESEFPRLATVSALKDFRYTVWTGVFVPRATPNEAVERLHVAVDQALRQPEFLAYTREAGGVARERALPLAEAEAYYRSEAQRLQQVFAAAGMKAA